MAFTDKDESDLKAIATGKAGYFSDEYGRQFKGKKREAEAAPRPIVPDLPFRPNDRKTNPEAFKKGGVVKKPSRLTQSKTKW